MKASGKTASGAPPRAASAARRSSLASDPSRSKPTEPAWTTAASTFMADLTYHPAHMPAETPIRVLIADDQALIREGLDLLLGQFPELEVVGAAADGESALAMAAELLPDVVLMDIVMPGMDGVDATRQILAVLPHTQVVILTAYADDESIFAAISAGASGYLTKDSGGEQIRRAIATVQAGGALVDTHVERRLLEHVRAGTTKHAPEPPP